MKKIGFLFGAGAERCYPLPSGAEYVSNTFLKNKKELYEALRNFYSGRAVDGYAENYRAEFIFYPDRHAYRRMVELSVRSALGIKDDHKEKGDKEERDINIVEFCYGHKISFAEHETYKGKIQKAYCEYRESKCRKSQDGDGEFPPKTFSIDPVIKVLYMLSLKYDLNKLGVVDKTKFAKQNKNLKSDLYDLLFVNVERKEDATKDDSDRFEQYNKLSKNEKKFIAHLVKNNLKYYGTVEQDFSTIINPLKAGIGRFWRLVNYFWSAYFAILIPMIELSSKYRELMDNEEQIYEKLLNADVDGQPLLVELLHYLASEDYLNESQDNAKNTPYYAVLKKEKVAIDFVLTANYTPYVKTLNLKTDEYCYLAGSVFQFELPYELRRVNVLDNTVALRSKDLVFPYIMTQAPVKPIVEPHLIMEYSRAIGHLEQCKLLIILGYSLCENDNHINSLLRHYITKPDKKMLICHYCSCQSKLGEKEERSLYNKLRVKGIEVADKIDFIINDGNTVKLVEKIKKYIGNM